MEQGMLVIEKRAQERLGELQVPDEFVITSLEIVVHRHIKLGSGGFAEVYEADWNKAKVAVKIFPKGVVPGVSHDFVVAVLVCLQRRHRY